MKHPLIPVGIQKYQTVHAEPFDTLRTALSTRRARLRQAQPERFGWIERESV